MLDLIDEYQQYQEAELDDEMYEDEEGYSGGYGAYGIGPAPENRS